MRERYTQLALCRKEDGWAAVSGRKGLARMCGFPREAEDSGDIFAFVREEDQKLLSELLEGEKIFCPIFVLRCAGGAELPALIQVQELPGGAYLMDVMDISGSLQSLWGLQNRLTALRQSGVVSLCEFLADENFTVTWNNQAFLEMAGYTREQFSRELGYGIKHVLYHEDLPGFFAQVREICQKPGESCELKLRIIRRNRELRLLKMAVGCTGEENGGFPVLCGMLVEAVRKSEEEKDWRIEEYPAAGESSKDFVWEYDIPGRRILGAKSLEMLLGVNGDLTGMPEAMIKLGLVHEDSRQAFCECFESIHSGASSAVCVARICGPQGEYIPIRISVSAVPNGGKPPVRASILTVNIAEPYSVEMHRREQEEWLAAVTYGKTFAAHFDVTKDLVLEASTGIYPFYNSDTSYLIEELIGTNVKDYIHPDDHDAYILHFSRKSMMESFDRGVPELIFEYRASRHGEAYRWRQSTMHLVRDPGNRDVCAYVYVKDITGQKIKEEELRRNAERDSLTGLYNRMASEAGCGRLLAQKRESLCALMMLDLDDLKSINDAYGHTGGDQAIRQIAKHLDKLFNGPDAVVGRLGGDEFIVFLANCQSMDAIQRSAQQICAIPDSPLPCALSCSVGIAVAPYDGESFVSLYKCADAALYQAKREGKKRSAFYDKSYGSTLTEKNPVSRDWLLEESSDLVYVADLSSYDLLYMNHGAQKAFHVEGDAYKGRKCYQVLQGMSEPCGFCPLDKLSRDAFYCWELDNRLINSHFMLRDRIVDWYGMPAHIEFATNVTELYRRIKAQGD